jgi:hypothetical protein
MKARIIDDGHRLIELSAVLSPRAPDDRPSINAWYAARRLEESVNFYRWEKYPAMYIAGKEYGKTLPPVSLDELRELVEAAEDAVPEYPLVRSARFYYEVEAGNRDACWVSVQPGES